MRKDIKAKFWLDAVGAVMSVVGLAGIAGAAEGQGNIIVAITVFSVGFGICLWGYSR